MSTYPGSARFIFGDWRFGEARVAADITGAIAGLRGSLAAFALEADIPALFRKAPTGALGSKLDFGLFGNMGCVDSSDFRIP